VTDWEAMMATLAELRERSEALFTNLLTAQTQRARAPRRVALTGVRRPGAATFSWFEPADAVAAASLSFRLSALAASKVRATDALESALDHAEEAAAASHPELVRQGLALFVTHNRDGRRLAKPRTVSAAPALFRPPAVRGGRAKPISIGGASPGLDYWREDALANEHHQHWHEVYPFTGLPPRDFRVWAAETPRSTMVAILDTLAPGQDWAGLVSSASVSELARIFAQVAQDRAVFGLPRDLYRALFRLNDRQGELFFYMHQQMLARYDAELVSNGLARSTAFGPSQWSGTIPEGHDPIGLDQFSRRDQDRRLAASDVSTLRDRQREINDSLTRGTLRGPDGTQVPIDRTSLGEAVEATIAQLRDLDPDSYRGLHNAGHGAISRLSTPPRPGVMVSTVTAIRDQIFWRWHKHIDDINAGWQDTQAPVSFDDAPPVIVRNGLAPESTTTWASPDIILCNTSDLPPDANRERLGEQLFGGPNWLRDFSAAEATADGITLRTVSELTTTMARVRFGGREVRFLTHEPFSYFLRMENPTDLARDVTVRIFLVPSAQARDRRAWIEMDKFALAVPAHTQLVTFRSDADSSVIKRPIDLNPARALAGGSGPDENTYCDCGWPYTLLLPRGTPQGLSLRLLMMCTDAAADRVPEQEHCGSMSFCGAVDRYPDNRDMGYPFARPFPGAKASAIRDAIVAMPNGAARTLTIRHTG
jgi:hypothetical protein